MNPEISFRFVRYEMVRVTEQKLEPSANGKGLFNYLWNEVEKF